ncbi:MAG TPA: PHB depolymerase family esterase [Acidimicrobiales bacterium]|nr:PHB depolymerase family esterase [Acidimicrobiales bacterium]
MRRWLAVTIAIAAVSLWSTAGIPLHTAPVDITEPPRCTPVSSTTSPSLAHDGWDWAGEPAGTHLFCSYSTQGLTRTYWLYEPPSAAAGRPLLVVLHGCSQQAQDIAYLSAFDTEADTEGFDVVYPNQAAFTSTGTSFDGNGGYCWNWFLPQGQERGSGEPALIAGITSTVTAAMQSDTSRVFVLGVSAGAAMADIMAATYPELYASVGIIAGCEYRGLPCFTQPSVLPPQVSGLLAYQASEDRSGASRAHVMPFFVENGDADPVVPVANALEAAQQWLVTDDFAAHGGILGKPVPSSFCAHTGPVVPSSLVDTGADPPVAKTPYDIFYYSLDGSACASDSAAALGQLWIVHGELHAWPGGPNLNTNPSGYTQPGSDGNPSGNPEGYGRIYTNPGGPNITDALYRFFMAHPCTLSGGLCAAGG